MDIRIRNGEKHFTTKGDNAARADNGERTEQELYAQYAFKIPYLGLLITFFSSIQGVLVILINGANFLFLRALWRAEKEYEKIYVDVFSKSNTTIYDDNL